jgi:hypothetical protein
VYNPPPRLFDRNGVGRACRLLFGLGEDEKAMELFRQAERLHYESGVFTTIKSR